MLIFKATAALNELMEVITGSGIWKNEEVEIKVIFDEIKLNVDIHYKGEEIEASSERPEPEALLENDKSYLKLAGYLVGKLADKVSTSAKAEHQHIKLHFDH